MATITVPVMTLKITVDGAEKTFTSPLAETILAQVRGVVVGQEQIQYFDTTDNTFKSFTYCCGDKYEFSYSTTTVTLMDTEYDCYGFPITYPQEDSTKFTTTVANGTTTITKVTPEEEENPENPGQNPGGDTPGGGDQGGDQGGSGENPGGSPEA